MSGGGFRRVEWGEGGDQATVELSESWPYRLSYSVGDPSEGFYRSRWYFRLDSAEDAFERKCDMVDKIVASIQTELDRA